MTLLHGDFLIRRGRQLGHDLLVLAPKVFDQVLVVARRWGSLGSRWGQPWQGQEIQDAVGEGHPAFGLVG